MILIIFLVFGFLDLHLDLWTFGLGFRSYFFFAICCVLVPRVVRVYFSGGWEVKAGAVSLLSLVINSRLCDLRRLAGLCQSGCSVPAPGIGFAFRLIAPELLYNNNYLFPNRLLCPFLDLDI